jgi:hypothetical protein
MKGDHMPEGAATVQFMDGAAGDEQVEIFLACDLQTGNYDLTRLCYRLPGDQWKYFDVPFIVVSVLLSPTTDPAVPRVLALGRDGRVWLANSGTAPRTERIADAGTGRGKYGYLSRVRQIAGKFYICGDQGQVYVRRGGGWQHMDRGLLHARRAEGIEIGLNGIDGTAPNDIYVVGDAGAIFHFDGTRWEDVGIDTSLDLESVRCVSRDVVYVCGGMGTLLTGNRQGWRRLAEGETENNLWDLEMFGGRLYLASDPGLLAYDATSDAIIPVDTGLSPKPDGHRLSTNVRELWSIGENHLARFDGVAWELIVHPDNRP